MTDIDAKLEAYFRRNQELEAEVGRLREEKDKWHAAHDWAEEQRQGALRTLKSLEFTIKKAIAAQEADNAD